MNNNTEQAVPGYSRLIKAAAELALQTFMPSDIVDDYPSKTMSTAKVAKMMETPRDRLRLLSIEVSEAAKQMLAAAPQLAQPSAVELPEPSLLPIAHIQVGDDFVDVVTVEQAEEYARAALAAQKEQHP
jgi:hypothetical protein